MQPSIKPIAGLAAAILATATLTSGLTSPVQAAAPASAKPVTINKIANVKVTHGKKALITPSATPNGNVVIGKTTLTVKKGKKTVAKNKPQVRLKAGKYKVTTKVVYRTYTQTTSKGVAYKAGQTVPASCTAAEFDTFSVHSTIYSHGAPTGLGGGGSTAIFTGPVLCTGTFTGQFTIVPSDGTASCPRETDSFSCSTDHFSLASSTSGGGTSFDGTFVTDRDLQGTIAGPRTYAKPKTVTKTQKLVVRQTKAKKK